MISKQIEPVRWHAFRRRHAEGAQHVLSGLRQKQQGRSADDQDCEDKQLAHHPPRRPQKSCGVVLPDVVLFCFPNIYL
jgi:hypothetical protein